MFSWFGYHTVVEWYSVGFHSVIIDKLDKTNLENADPGIIDTCKQLDLMQREIRYMYLSTIKNYVPWQFLWDGSLGKFLCVNFYSLFQKLKLKKNRVNLYISPPIAALQVLINQYFWESKKDTNAFWPF